MTREAERAPRARAYRYRLKDHPGAVFTMIAPNADMTEAKRSLAWRYGDRVSDVVEVSDENSEGEPE